MVTFFSLFIIGGLIGLFKFKQIVLTKNEIKIIFPFLFKTKYYNLQDIKAIEEKDFKIEPLVRQSRMTVHEGKETIVEFKTNSDVLAFNTLETNNYFEFIKVLRQTQNKKEWNSLDFIPYDSTWSIIAWGILIIIVLTIGALKMYVG
jgi:hypothetical protein